MVSKGSTAVRRALGCILLGSMIVSCTLALDTTAVQCRSDSDCKGADPQAAAQVCRDQVCVAKDTVVRPGPDASTPDGNQPTDAGEESALPFAVDEAFFTSGYMGDGERQLITEHACPAGPRGGEGRGRCHEFIYKTGPASMGWGGLYWQYPANNWDKAPGFVIPAGAKSVAFYAWAGAEATVVTFAVGILQTDGFEVRSSEVPLSTSPRRYVIDLGDVTYEDVVGAFSFSTMAPPEGTTLELYLDDIVWSDEPALVATTFAVDTSAAPPASDCGVRLRGSFDDWGIGIPMKDDDKNGSYEVSVDLRPNRDVQYRFATTCDGGVVDEVLSSDAPCAPIEADGGRARAAKVPHGRSQVAITCMGKCGACDAGPASEMAP